MRRALLAAAVKSCAATPSLYRTPIHRTIPKLESSPCAMRMTSGLQCMPQCALSESEGETRRLPPFYTLEWEGIRVIFHETLNASKAASPLGSAPRSTAHR
jgi:hypothetical protein